MPQFFNVRTELFTRKREQNSWMLTLMVTKLFLFHKYILYFAGFICWLETPKVRHTPSWLPIATSNWITTAY